MNSVVNKQRGMSLFMILILASFAGFAGLFAVKVGPGYLEYMTVSKIADETAENAQVMGQPRSKVLSHIDQAYRTNNLWDLRANETITLSKKGRSGYTIEVDYEKRSNLFANIHVVTVFKKTAGTP